MNHRSWKIIQNTFLLILLLATFTFAGGHQVGQARATIPVNVPTGVEWVSTGIWLYTAWVGTEVKINTVGSVSTWQGNQGSFSGPEGQSTICQDSNDGEIVYSCALAGAPFGQLIGRVGNVVFPISNATSFTIPTNGFLYLTVNDYLGTYFDNTGQFAVLIELK